MKPCGGQPERPQPGSLPHSRGWGGAHEVPTCRHSTRHLVPTGRMAEEQVSQGFLQRRNQAPNLPRMLPPPKAARGPLPCRGPSQLAGSWAVSCALPAVGTALSHQGARRPALGDARQAADFLTPQAARIPQNLPLLPGCQVTRWCRLGWEWDCLSCPSCWRRTLALVTCS